MPWLKTTVAARGTNESDTLVPPAELMKELSERFGESRLLGDAASKALEVASDPHCDAGQIARIIEADPQLASHVLMVANSARYSAGRQISSLERAITQIGFSACQHLVVSASISRLMEEVSLGDEIIRARLQRHAYLTGALCRNLNTYLRLGFGGLEFTAGLVHDLGHVLLACSQPALYTKVVELQLQDDEENCARERRLLGIDHAAIGALILEQNRVPDDLIEPVLLHHRPDASRKMRPLTFLVAFADRLAVQGTLDTVPDPSEWLADPVCLELLRFRRGNTVEEGELLAGLPQLLADSQIATDAVMQMR